MEVDIGGVKHVMSGNGTKYKQGVVFTYSEQENTPGELYYRFVFDDGSDPWYVEDGLVTETPVVLTNTSVTSTTRTSTTLFTFSTNYSEWQNSAPTSAQLFIDTTAYPMMYVSGQYNTGALFQYSTELPVGNHTFYVVFSMEIHLGLTHLLLLHTKAPMWVQLRIQQLLCNRVQS